MHCYQNRLDTVPHTDTHSHTHTCTIPSAELGEIRSCLTCTRPDLWPLLPGPFEWDCGENSGVTLGTSIHPDLSVWLFPRKAPEPGKQWVCGGVKG